jgi:hypothetical protein
MKNKVTESHSGRQPDHLCCPKCKAIWMYEPYIEYGTKYCDGGQDTKVIRKYECGGSVEEYNYQDSSEWHFLVEC